MRLLVIDPRRTASCEGADLHLAIRPGTDAQLWNGLLVRLAERGTVDHGFLDRHTEGFAEALAAAQCSAGSLAGVAAGTGLKPSEVETFFSWWAATPRVVSCYSQGINQSAQGTDKVNAIINCHLATGRIGKPGAGPLSLTGQPNAMGGREVGGLANVLAAHMGFSVAERERVRRFWNAPNVVQGEGYKAVRMFEGVAAGEIKALWVMATNPAVSLPLADEMRLGLRALELFVVSDNVATNDTVRLAHVRLPAAAWGEKDGTVTNSERSISRQRAFLPAPGAARPDWWMLAQVARRLGWGAAFDYSSPAEIFREHARLSGFENVGRRAFDISGLADISDEQYARLEPVQWPVTRTGNSRRRLFGDGQFFSSNGRSRLVPVAHTRLAAPPSQRWPFVLNTGRVRDHWHTMTRTGLSARLSQHLAEPFVEVAPGDAERLRLEQGRLARVSTASASADLRVLVADGQKEGTLFVPIHWSSVNSSAGRIGSLVHALTDPISGQPDAKGTPARLDPLPVGGYGFVLSRTPMRRCAMLYWACARTSCGWLTNFALGEEPTCGWAKWSSDVLPAGEYVSVADASSGLYRVAVLSGGGLEAVLCVAADPKLPRPETFKPHFALPAITPEARRELFASLSAGATDRTAIVCVCYEVGERDIQAALDGGARTVEGIGRLLGAGTNCGSCIPEISRLIVRQAGH
jgi:assimilatory nitrate reductase catalytic subunit